MASSPIFKVFFPTMANRIVFYKCQPCHAIHGLPVAAAPVLSLVSLLPLQAASAVGTSSNLSYCPDVLHLPGHYPLSP